MPQSNISIRLASSTDAPAVHRLAALDSADPPSGPVLVAEAGRTIVAALPLRGGRPIADPFTPTAGLVEILELRRSQIAA
jgi:hypothetical protein